MRMILDAVLLSIVKLCPNGDSVAILPEWKLLLGEGVTITNPSTQYEVSLTGSVDYGIIRYEKTEDNHG